MSRSAAACAYAIRRSLGSAGHGDVLSVDVAAAGDFSVYTLRLVAGAGVAAPPAGIDPALAQIEFRFKVDCPSDFDCKPASACQSEHAIGPVIDYLARDYASFRRLVLDRFAALMPNWHERNPADLWVTLAEVGRVPRRRTFVLPGRCRNGGLSRHGASARLGAASYAAARLRLPRRLQRARLGRASRSTPPPTASRCPVAIRAPGSAAPSC